MYPPQHLIEAPPFVALIDWPTPRAKEYRVQQLYRRHTKDMKPPNVLAALQAAQYRARLLYKFWPALHWTLEAIYSQLLNFEFAVRD